MIYVHNKGEIVASFEDPEDMYNKLKQEITQLKEEKKRAFSKGFYRCLFIYSSILLAIEIILLIIK